MVTSPSNPTGTTIDFDVLKGVCDLARFRGAWRIIDETYLDLADREPDGSEVRSALLADPDAIICNSFSKFFGMTGWRLGWAVVPEYTIERSTIWRPTIIYARTHPPSMLRSPASRPNRWRCARNADRSCSPAAASS